MCFSVKFHIVDLWQYYVCCKRPGETRCTLFMFLYMSSMCHCWVTRGALVAPRYTCATPHSITSLFCRTFHSPQVSLWNILLTPYSMVWDWRVLREGPIHNNFSKKLIPFCLLQFSFSLLSLYRLVLWGWGLQTDRVSIALSRPGIADLFQ